MQRTLAFDDTPSLSASLRYFLTAPLFLLAAALLLVWQGPAVLTSRWSPATLALTHLTTLGFLGLTMIGALFQILPVVAAVVLPRARLTSNGVFLLLLAGAILLPVAFILAMPSLFKVALTCLSGAFLWLLGAVAKSLARISDSSASTIRTMRFALAALAAAVLFGAALAAAFAWPAIPLPLPLPILTDLHVLWALPGWVGLLVIGVAFQVVPMFMVTQIFAKGITRWLPVALLLLLTTCTATLVAWPGLARCAGVALAAAFAVFAAATLRLLSRRIRPEADSTTLFWRIAMLSLLCCAVAWIACAAFDIPVAPITLGALFTIGFAGSAINGMLYKIVPFLLWYHARAAAGIGHRTPSVKQMLPDADARTQFYLYGCALTLLMAASILPTVFARPAGIALAISAGLLEINLLGAVRRYRRTAHPTTSIGVVA